MYNWGLCYATFCKIAPQKDKNLWLFETFLEYNEFFPEQLVPVDILVETEM